MKGPGGRMRFDLRRVWECPVCHRRDWTPGEIVFRACTCSTKGDPTSPVWMKLIEEEPAAAVAGAPPDLQAAPIAGDIQLQSTPASTPGEQSEAPTPTRSVSEGQNGS
jgi:hypothetical protein